MFQNSKVKLKPRMRLSLSQVVFITMAIVFAISTVGRQQWKMIAEQSVEYVSVDSRVILPEAAYDAAVDRELSFGPEKIVGWVLFKYILLQHCDFNQRGYDPDATYQFLRCGVWMVVSLLLMVWTTFKTWKGAKQVMQARNRRERLSTTNRDTDLLIRIQMMKYIWVLDGMIFLGVALKHVTLAIVMAVIFIVIYEIVVQEKEELGVIEVYHDDTKRPLSAPRTQMARLRREKKIKPSTFIQRVLYRFGLW